MFSLKILYCLNSYRSELLSTLSEFVLKREPFILICITVSGKLEKFKRMEGRYIFMFLFIFSFFLLFFKMSSYAEFCSERGGVGGGFVVAIERDNRLNS